MFKKSIMTGVCLMAGFLVFMVISGNGAEEKKVFRAGAAIVDTTPIEFPRKCNGGFSPHYLSKVADPLHVRALVLDDGVNKVAIAVIDACGMNAELRDEIAMEVEKKTGIPQTHISISSTHCHSAPALTLILGCGPDEDYVKFVKPKMIEALIKANANLTPAEVGWGFSLDRDNVYCRRFLMKPGTAQTLPTAFTGAKQDIAMMNPGMNNPNAITRTGVPDPTVSVLALRNKKTGKPLALLGNYSTHYAGAANISADYFAVFCNRIAELIQAPDDFVALMTNGTSGDVNCIDFLNPKRVFSKETVGESVAQAAFTAFKEIQFLDWVPVVMEQSKLTLNIRKPSQSDVQEAKKYVEKEKITIPRNTLDCYALDTIALDTDPPTKTIILQAIRIGGLGIATIPCEVYSFTGRDIKSYSPTEQTFTISLANGYYGYIPTVESFELGGYNTWRARSCCLEVEAEPKIRAEVLRLLKNTQK